MAGNASTPTSSPWAALMSGSDHRPPHWNAASPLAKASPEYHSAEAASTTAPDFRKSRYEVSAL